MKTESKSWQRFEGKLRNLKQYLQLMDLSLSISNKQCNKRVTEEIKIGIALGGNEESHRQLNIPNQNKDIKRTFIAARKQLNEQAIVELHCLFSDYISHIISEIAHGNPKCLLGILGSDAERTICFADIVNLGSYDAVINEMAKRVFRILENLKSSTDMMKKLVKITKIQINDDLMHNALVYIDVRHLIIHNDSIADEQFIQRDSTGLIPLNKNKLALNYETTNKATNTIYELCKTIDEELIKKKFLPIRPQK